MSEVSDRVIRHRAKLQKENEQLRKALRQFKQREGLDGRPCFCLNDVKNVAWSSGHSRVCRTAREALHTTQEPEE